MFEVVEAYYDLSGIKNYFKVVAPKHDLIAVEET